MAIPVGAAIIGSTILQGIGGLFSGSQQGKLNKEQLKLQARRLGLDEKQLAHLIAQAERMNAIQSQNVGRINPMLDAMIQRGQEGATARPTPVRLAPPVYKNSPHSVNTPRPPAITGLPGFSPFPENQDGDPRDLARMLAFRGY